MSFRTKCGIDVLCAKGLKCDYFEYSSILGEKNFERVYVCVGLCICIKLSNYELKFFNVAERTEWDLERLCWKGESSVLCGAAN